MAVTQLANDWRSDLNKVRKHCLVGYIFPGITTNTRENRTEYEVNILSLGDDMAEFIGHFFICCYTHCACVVVCTRVNSIQMGYEFINYIHCVNIGIFL